MGDRAEGGNVGFGRGHAQLPAGVQGNDLVGQFGEGRTGLVDEGDDEGAARLGALDGGQQVGALAGLRDRQADHAAHVW